MAITISTLKSQNIIEGLIRSEFDKVDFSTEYIYNKAGDLIETAKNYGLHDLADKMQADKLLEIWC